MVAIRIYGEFVVPTLVPTKVPTLANLGCKNRIWGGFTPYRWVVEGAIGRLAIQPTHVRVIPCGFS